MKFLLFGTGDYYHRLKKWFKKDDILALLDNNLSVQSSRIDDIPVMSPADGVKLPYDAIIVLSVYIAEMKEQLINLGVQAGKIYHFHELHKILDYEKDKKQIKVYGNKTAVYDNKRRVLLLTQDLALGGPAIALEHMGEAMTKFGYNVTFASMEDGPLREKLTEDGFSVVIDENIQIFTMNECSWTQNYDLIVANTINYYYFLSKRDTSKKIIWWLHDSEFFYHGVEKKILADMDMTNINMASVGTVPEKAFNKYRSDLSFYNLCYGVKDTGWNDSVRHNGRVMKFITIGFIEWRKGQDILIKAIEGLPEDILEACEFTFVGADTSSMARSLKEETSMMYSVLFTGKVSRDRINELLSEADVLICPSREDPMPTVAAEAMMHGVPCIVSDATGTAEYIDTRKNGIVVHCEDVDDLKNQINWCINNRDKVNAMRPYARNVYEAHFTEEIFENDLKRLVESI